MQETLDPFKNAVPVLADPNLVMTLTEVSNGQATLIAVHEGIHKELVVQRSPPALHVYNVIEHGRRWVRDLVYTSNAGRCYGVPPGESSIVATPAPRWHVGDVATPSGPAPSLVIAQRIAANEEAIEYFVPARHLNGYLPFPLLMDYLFWRRSDGLTIVGVRKAKKGDDDDGPAPAVAAGGDGPAGGDGATSSDELTIRVSGNGAVVTKTPLDGSGVAIKGDVRRLIATLSHCDQPGFGELVALLERVEDLAYVLLWSPKESERSNSANNPFGGFGGGSDDNVPIALIELPRLHLVFEAVRHQDGGGRSSVRYYSKEHPGHYIAPVDGERMKALLRGLPHALVLVNDEGDAFVLLSALARPCQLADPAKPLASQLLLSRHSREWNRNIAGVKHYLYAVHRSQSFLVPPSLAATLNLLALRWLARDFEAAFALCPACATDSALTPDEKQLCLSFDSDVEPETHACRLRLTLAWRACADLPSPWSVPEQLSLYLTKIGFIPASCQLSASDELTLLRMYRGESDHTARMLHTGSNSSPPHLTSLDDSSHALLT